MTVVPKNNDERGVPRPATLEYERRKRCIGWSIPQGYREPGSCKRGADGGRDTARTRAPL